LVSLEDDGGHVATELDLTGRIALVTGGVRGVGLGVARAFLDAGATVVTCSRTPPEVPVEAAGGRAEHVTADVRDPDSVSVLVEGVVATHGRLDVLVNNAGGAPYALAADASPRFHSKVVDLNLLSPLLVSQAANAVMQRQDAGGAIVMVSSISATRPSPGTAAYGAAKAGVDSLVRSLAVEWAPKVRLNAIDVGLVRTEQTDLHYGGEAGVAAIEATIPMGRLARPEEVGQVAAFLASPLASYVSGATLAVHGGGEPPPFLAAASSAVGEAQTATTGTTRGAM
jgi:NAD(P)-dependent dehydrogenase (short-subunit alcohol dehydrogenase family)